METIRTYKTPQDFLDDSESLLEQRELVNNLILGLCYGFPDRTKEYSGCVFINSVDDDKIQATSIKTISKAIVAGTTKNKSHIKLLADFYSNNQIDLSGVFGESFYPEMFSEFYRKEKISTINMMVHQLTTINNLPLATGNFEMSNASDADLMAEWMMRFEEDAKIFPKKSKEQTLSDAQIKIEREDLFKWVDNGETASICAIVRKTKNLGIVGLVYTPAHLRGKGYATSCVQKLSEHILQRGFKGCGLFTDKANPTSNNIYKKIGYVASAEFSDIEFA